MGYKSHQPLSPHKTGIQLCTNKALIQNVGLRYGEEQIHSNDAEEAGSDAHQRHLTAECFINSQPRLGRVLTTAASVTDSDPEMRYFLNYTLTGTL